MIRLRDEATSTSPPSLQLPSASRREDRPEVTLPPRKRLGITLGPRYKKQMAQRRTTRSIADQETVNATTVTNAQLQTMIDQGVTVALAARDALRSTNGDDSHNSETGVRRTERAARECTYTDFLKCQPLPFKGPKELLFFRNGTVGHEATYGMSWKTLLKMMTDKYCPQNEIRKLEMEL
nr:hypothetical protein [Tanacetum cinerariifolium]